MIIIAIIGSEGIELERFANYTTVTGEYDDCDAGNAVAGTMCALFKAAEDDFAVALLANSEHRMERWVKRGTDDFSSYKWRIIAPPSLYIEYRKQEDVPDEYGYYNHRSDFLWEAKRLGGELLDEVKEIVVTPRVESDEHWRLGAQAYLAGLGINNQGNVFAKNRPRIVHDELFFRTIGETYLYDALVNLRLPVMPLPVILRIDGTKRPDGTNTRIEPDFCFLYRGRFVVVELDGGSHLETPSEAERRLQYLRESGAIVRRLPVSLCSDPDSAKTIAAQLMKGVDKEIDAR